MSNGLVGGKLPGLSLLLLLLSSALYHIACINQQIHGYPLSQKTYHDTRWEVKMGLCMIMEIFHNYFKNTK